MATEFYDLVCPLGELASLICVLLPVSAAPARRVFTSGLRQIFLVMLSPFGSEKFLCGRHRPNSIS